MVVRLVGHKQRRAGFVSGEPEWHEIERQACRKRVRLPQVVLAGGSRNVMSTEIHLHAVGIDISPNLVGNLLSDGQRLMNA
jgi:hypothetical protein